MNKSLIICDQIMFGALLGLIWVIPYSPALIEAFILTMITSWVTKHVLLFRESRRQGLDGGSALLSSGMEWPLIALGLLIILTIPISHFPLLSLKKVFSRFLQQICIMYCVAEIIQSRKRLFSVLGVLTLMVFCVSLYALSQYVFGHNILEHAFGRVSGPMHHPNDLGTFLVTLLPVVLALLLTTHSWFSSLFKAPLSERGPLKFWRKGLMGVVFFVLVSALGLTSSRGAWVAFAVSMIVLGFYLRRRGVIAFIVTMLVLFFGVFGMYCLSTRIDIYPVPMTQGPAMKPTFTNPWGLPAQYDAFKILLGISGRELYWDTAIGVIKRYPWFGCGYSAYVQTLKDLQVGHTEYPHNSLLHITAELGIVGLCLYLWLFAALCMKAWRTLRAVFADRGLYVLGCGISCGLLAWMVHSLVDTPWSSLQLSILLWLMMGVLLSLNNVVPLYKEGTALKLPQRDIARKGCSSRED